MFQYGMSKVYFRNGRVEAWHISGGSPLRARLLPRAPVETHGYFTVGSTKDEVLAVQGTPTSFSDYWFGYGLSKVYFRDERVDSWSMSPGSPLKVRRAATP
jgi:hypothetical protein